MKIPHAGGLIAAVAAVAVAAWWARSPDADPAPGGVFAAQAASPAATTAAPLAVDDLPGMPAVTDRSNLYSETASDRLSAAVSNALPRVYVPNHTANTLSVIDPATMQVVATHKVGLNPQHVVPSWDLRTLWVANNAENTTTGSMTPIDPTTGKVGKPVKVDDPYNVYWMPDGSSAIIVAEALKRLDFRDPQTMALQFSIETPACAGINHADFSIDGRWALFTCEFDGAITKIDLVERKVLGTLKLSRYWDRQDIQALLSTPGKKPVKVPDPNKSGDLICTTKGMPQDVRISPDGKTFFVADMMADGVHVVDGASLTQTGFIPTGVGAHGLYPSRDGRSLYVANRGSNRIHGKPRGQGSVSVIDFATRQVVKTWPIPGGGSPDMGNVSADGRDLWLAGRYDDVVYRIDTSDGSVRQVKVGKEPHGLTVWPQPGRYSLGHTGNLR